MTARPPDQAARDRILADLDTNLLVEAGAGSGKTSSLVGRMASLVRSGVPLEQVAAITFSRKAASELRERFQLGLETAEDLADALRDMDRGFIGTIHAFAARLLREHPVEAGLDPGFEEVDEVAWPELCRTFWDRWLERLRLEQDPRLQALAELGVQPSRLHDTFVRLAGEPDVTFPAPSSPAPDGTRVRRQLEKWVEELRARMPADEPAAGWDKLQASGRHLYWLQQTTDWSRPADLARAVGGLGAAGVVLNRWSLPKEQVKALHEEWVAWIEGPVAAWLAEWREHCYRPVMEFLNGAVEEFRRERRAMGRLSFGDLLSESVRMLKEQPRVREALGTRWRRLLVDEFQDTDPLQAELCLLLASPAEQGGDWRRLVPRPGGLFLVGDPKQSIYRFRRADIATYASVRSRFEEWNGVVRLTAAFRARQAVADVVNAHFKDHFPEHGSGQQAAYAPLEPQREPTPIDGVFLSTVHPADANKDAILAADAERIAQWIASELAEPPGSRAVEPSDFMILTRTRTGIAEHARALAAWGVPVITTNARLGQEQELSELILLLQALADPTNPLLVAAALEGLFFGCTPADLWEAKRAGAEFKLVLGQSGLPGPVGPALERMRGWAEAAASQPADAVVDRVLDETGLLAWAASEPLGEGRAGVLMRLVETLRAEGEALDLRAALGRIEQALAGEGFDVPLRPFRGSAVRVMNLHQAKGLEAHTVVLAGPVVHREFAVESHVSRAGDGPAGGWLLVQSGDDVVAQPPGWADHAAAEAEFGAAEEVRLLYVAATRAAHRLVVSKAELPRNKDGSVKKAEGSPWAALDPVLIDAPELGVREGAEPPGRPVLNLSVEEVEARVSAAEARVQRAVEPTWRLDTVTFLVKTPEGEGPLEREERQAYDLSRPAGRGRMLGSVVHRLLEGRLRGRSGAGFEAWARAVVADEAGGTDDDLLAEALRLVAQAEATPAWQRLNAGGGEAEVPVMVARRQDGRVQVIEGVLDAVVRDAAGVLVVDWKTDAGHPEWEERLERYRAQVAMYAELLSGLTGEVVEGEVVGVG